MQITEQIIQRIARQVFNQMFPSSLRQSGAVISGAGSSVQYAVEAGHAASADNATYATSAGSVTWSGISGKPASKTAWGQSYLNASSEFQTITGDMSNVGNISFAATGKNIGGIAYFDTTNSRLGIGTSSPSYTLHVNGTAYASTALAHGDISIGNTNEINSTSNLYLQYRETGHVVMCIGGGNVGIGTSSPSQALHVVGAIYCTSGFTFLSDIRKKDVITYQWAPALSAIAEAPIIRYTLKDDKEKRERIGSVAQYWQKITPEAVTETDDTLSMDGATIALTSVIALAREVKQLKAQVARLTQQRNG